MGLRSGAALADQNNFPSAQVEQSKRCIRHLLPLLQYQFEEDNVQPAVELAPHLAEVPYASEAERFEESNTTYCIAAANAEQHMMSGGTRAHEQIVENCSPKAASKEIMVEIHGQLGGARISGLGTKSRQRAPADDGGSPANGNYDLWFKLYDDPNTGTQVGPTVTLNAPDGIVIAPPLTVNWKLRGAVALGVVPAGLVTLTE